MAVRRLSLSLVILALAAVASLTIFASSAKAIGPYKYGLTGGVPYSSGGWQAGGTNDLLNGNIGNIGVAYIDIYRNGYGFWSSNSPGVFLAKNALAIICIAANCNPGYSVIGNCKSSNTRADASCAIG